MKILSWNIWIKCEFEGLKKYLQESNADIIGLQEVKQDDPERDVISFLEDLGYHSFFAETEQVWDGERYRHGPAIFSKFPIVASEKIQLEVGDDERAAAYAKIDANGTMFDVFSVHLVHTHQQPSEEQDVQVKKLIKRIPTEGNVIVMGDFNAETKSNAVHLMRDILIDTDTKNLPTWSTNKNGCETCGVSGVTIKLDYIFVSNNLTFDEFKVEYLEASDHLPVSVNINLKN